jgi:hypothetical protein
MEQMDNRGVSEVIGFTLIFALIIVLLSLYQAQIIPNQNAQVEFKHSQDVQQDLMELRANILTTASGDTESTTRVTLGTQYPSRVVGVNPPPPAGSLRTVNLSGEAALEITNAKATDTEVADYWGGGSREYTTRGLKYTPQYSEYDNAPVTVYENSVLYNNLSTVGETRYAGLSEQQVVSGREIDLTALQGDIDQSGSMSMSVTAISPPGKTETIAIERQSGGNPITVQFPSELSAANWTTLLRDERAANGGYITAISKSGGRVRLEFKETGGAGNPITYELLTSAIGIGTGITDPSPAYVIPTSSTNIDVTPGETTEFVVKVRNGFNGPESNVGLSASASSGSASVSTRTDAEGQVTVDYTAPSSGSDTVTVEDDLDGSGTIEADEQVQFSVTVETGSGGGSGGGGAYAVNWQNPENDNSNSYLSDCSASGCTWDVGADSDNQLTLRSATSPALDGISIDFAVNDSAVGSVSPGSTDTGSDGEATADLTANANGVVGVYAASGGSSDVINITVQNVGGGGGVTYLEADDGSSNTAPTAIDLEEGGSYDGTYEAARIGIVNTESEPIDRVNSITVELPNAGGNIKRIDAPSKDRDSYGAEVYFAGNNNDGYIDLPDGSISLGSEASFESGAGSRQVGDIDSGSGIVVKLSQFRESGGGPSGRDTDITGRDVRLTITFEAGGSTYTETVDVTLNNQEQA